MELKLDQAWTVGDRIGGGGFGEVYEARSDSGEVAVVKLIPKAPGAQRELLFVDLEGVRNVIPVLDSGETADAWAIVMPRAEMSLTQYLKGKGRPLSVEEAVAVLTDIGEALEDLDGRVVHRDLKPDNVLLYEGRWCLADFGISRYAEATTAPDTRKRAMSPPYAAPERWRMERATSASDVYALGVIAYEMLNGKRPFPGTEWEDLREQHLHHGVPHLDDVQNPVGALVDECLDKAPGARPGPGNVLARLRRLADLPPESGLAKLQEVNRASVARRSEASRQESAARSAAETREQLFASACSAMMRTSTSLKAALVLDATAASIREDRNGGWSLRLEDAQLELTPANRTAMEPWGGWEPPAFTVVAHAELNLRIPAGRSQYEGRAHSLWYCDAVEPGRFQWFETAFMASAFMPHRGRQDPFTLPPGQESAKALWNGIAEWQVAWPFTPLTSGDSDKFISRWAGWLADAAQGKLIHPRMMPERDPSGSWRRS